MDTLSLSHRQPYRDLFGQTLRPHVQEKPWPQVCAVSVDTGCGDSCWSKHCKRVHTPTSWPLLMAIDDHGGNIQRPEATWTDLAGNSPPPVCEQQTKQKCRWQTRRRHRGCCGEPLGGLWLKPSRPLARQSTPYTADAFTQLKIALLVLSWKGTGLMYLPTDWHDSLQLSSWFWLCRLALPPHLINGEVDLLFKGYKQKAACASFRRWLLSHTKESS